MADNTLKERSLLSLYIFEILRKFSSKESPMSEKQIKEKINGAEIFQDSAMIKEEDRKIIPRHIRTLMEHFDGLIVQVETAKNKAAKWYYDGSKAAQFEFLSRNNFTADEIGFLVDMISSSKLVTEKSTSAFIAKLLNSLNEADEAIVSARQKIKSSKNENEYVHNIFDSLQIAIDEQNAVDITVTSDGDESKIIQNASVYSIYNKNKKSYVYMSDNDGEFEIEINKIKRIKTLGKSSNYNASILDKLEDQGLTQVTDKDGRSIDTEISNDTLFTNSRLISLAIREKKYLTFKDYKCNLIRFEETLTRRVVPITTIFKNGVYYLIAVEKINGAENPVFVRIDLIEDLKIGKELSDKDIEKLDTKSEGSYFNTNPYILSKTQPIKIKFYIDKKAIQRVADEFGNSADVIVENYNPLDTTSELVGKIGRLDPEFFTKSFTGFEYGIELSEVEAEATEEDAIRWALENADVVELTYPESLRIKLLEATKDLDRRYSKTEKDIEEEFYSKAISGDSFLEYGSINEYDRKTLERIKSQKVYDKITKLKIGNTDAPISKEELEKYINVEELVIDGNGIDDFSWIANLFALRRLTLVDTSLKDGSVLAELPQLDTLFINRNRDLENYEFLKNIRVRSLYIGENGKADISALYDLNNVEFLALEENLLFDIDIERLERLETVGKKRHHVIVERWIYEHTHSKLPKTYCLNYNFFKKS